MIGYHCSHEQFAPSKLLALVQQAEKAGFGSAMSSEHIAPWIEDQGHSGFAMSWLGAALQATSLPFGSLAIPGGWRYHPLVVAHAFATLAEMFPKRMKWIAVGSGEALNEHMVSTDWPDKPTRNKRMKEAVDMIRALWRGDCVTTDGEIKTHKARLWSLPDTPPKIYGAALSEETAEWMGSWADGLITVHKKPEQVQKIIDAFHRGGGKGKPMALQIHLSWDETDEKARYNAWHQWRGNILGPEACAEFMLPEHFDAASISIKPEDMDDHILISSVPARHIEWIKEFQGLGFDDLFLHNTGRNQNEFIEVFGRDVLPQLRS